MKSYHSDKKSRNKLDRGDPTGSLTFTLHKSKTLNKK